MGNQMKRYVERGLGRSRKQSYCPFGAGVLAPFQCECVHQPRTSPNPVLWGLSRHHHVCMISHQFHFLSLFLLKGVGMEVGVSGLKIPHFSSWSLWPPACPRRQMRVTSLEQRLSYSSRNYRSFRSPMSGIRVKNQILK